MGRRNCKKNQRTMYYALYNSKVPILDNEGNETFEYTTGYDEPVMFNASISTGNSDAEEAPFGSNVSYDRVIVTTDMSLPIDENSIIWKDNSILYNEDGTVDWNSADYRVASRPLDGLDSMRIAVKYNGNSVQTEEVAHTEPTEPIEPYTSSEDDGF